MKFSELKNWSQLVKETGRNLKDFVSQNEEFLRTSVSVSSDISTKDQNGEVYIKIPDYSQKEILYTLNYLQELPEDLQKLVRVYLYEDNKFRKICSELGFSPLTVNRELLFCYLVQKTPFPTTEEYFGWLRKKRKMLKFFYRRNRDLNLFTAPNRSRKRGYTDKGSLGTQFVGDKEYQRDYSSTSLQQEIEKKRKLKEYNIELKLRNLRF